jgi:precorrin-6B methylase 2
MPKTVHISPRVREVLAASIISGTADRPTLKLPEGQLDRLVYEATAKVLKALGGKWNRSAAGFIFDRPFEGELAGALSSGKAVDVKRGLEQFFTPHDLAHRLVSLARLETGQRVLEPSAGAGALVEAIAARHPSIVIDAVELDAALFDRLKSRWGLRASIFQGDFLAMPVLAFTPDAIVMNPPFSANKDIAHVMHAFAMLRPGGRLVAIMSPHFTFADDQPSREFRALIGYEAPPGRQTPLYECGGDGDVENCTVELLPAGAFKESGTGVSSVLVMIEKAG